MFQNSVMAMFSTILVIQEIILVIALLVFNWDTLDQFFGMYWSSVMVVLYHYSPSENYFVCR